jgi:hypothetical protein
MASSSSASSSSSLAGVLPITDRAAEVVRPEVEQRLRFIVQEALKIARHAQRTRLLPQDLAHAYNTWCRARSEPFVYGAGATGGAAASPAGPAGRGAWVSSCVLDVQPVQTYSSLYELLGAS